MARSKKTEVPKFELPKTEYEEGNKVLAKTFRNLYDAFLNEGFTEKQAMSLLKALINSPAMAKPQISMF